MANRTNKALIQRIVDEVWNAKRLDVLDELYAEDYVYHTNPYVGIGILTDPAQPEKVVIRVTTADGPADGKLLPGDEIVRAEDEEGMYASQAALKNLSWAYGAAGTTVQLGVKRAGEFIDIELHRAILEVTIDREGLKSFITNEFRSWPDLKVTVKQMIAEDDVVVCRMILTGTHTAYNRSVIWTQTTIYRIENGRVAEVWMARDQLNQQMQLGLCMRPKLGD